MLEHQEISSNDLVLVSCTQAFTLAVALKSVLPKSSLNLPQLLVAFTLFPVLINLFCVWNHICLLFT